MSDDQNTPEVDAPEADAPTAETGTKRQMSFALLDDGTIRADFTGLDPLILDPAAVPEHVQAAAIAEGYISRVRAYTSKLTDKERTPEALREAVAKGFAALLAGIWKVAREASAAEVTIEAEAAFRFRRARALAKGEDFTGTLEEAVTQFAALTDDQKKQLKAVPLYQAQLAEVKAERATAKAAKLMEKAKESPEADFF
jgi:hypothetical protein